MACIETYKKKISKEWYDLIKQKGLLSKQEEVELFGAATVWGYGLYGYSVYEEDGNYYCRYREGTSCD